MKLRMFLVYTEPSTMRMGEAGFEQYANMVSFRAPDFVPLTQFSLKKMYFSATGRCCPKRYLCRKIQISMIFVSPNSFFTLHRIKVLKKAKHRLLTCRHPDTRRMSLHLISEVKHLLHHVYRG